ncbi:PREDICTED: pentatricopeptide repeat-containing protein At2g13600 isoform X2 [Tarenaya hassleriana]|uniref:pentatricopeptide repeat-containing protein At2g13600 isoform X2 n=1 Tax=Tarenaya hassleriana TaxID=28532 RepID=UPI00053C93C4|nr:PREDICTED: pentatricopeptide repeat-containing protein At2g13600 isoform X2 [Tarenaya hassleriana]
MEWQGKFCKKSSPAISFSRIHHHHSRSFSIRASDQSRPEMCLVDGRRVFDEMSVRNIYSWNSVLTALTKSGFLDEAERMFWSMPDHDQCTWNSMVAGFAQHNSFEEALHYFALMHKKDFVLNEYTFGSGLSACAGLMDMKKGTQIHALIAKSPGLSDVYIGSALVDMYSKCGSTGSAQLVFDEMSDRNVVSWNNLITCYEQNGPAMEALKVFLMMLKSEFEPDEVTLTSVVSACASMSALKVGQEIHGRAIKNDKLRDDLVLSNAFVDMYAKCRRINEARYIFDRIPTKNIVSETSMVSGYAKTASTKAARLMFTEMIERNVISWNALIAGYTQNGENEEAINLFRILKRESVCPTDYTFGNLLNACANLADLHLGLQAHVHVLKHGFKFQSCERSDIFVGNALIDMYVKCGSVEDGYLAFKKMSERDCVSWNAMIVGYAQNGYGIEALALFREMLDSGEKPDHITMIGVLSACNHSGFVEVGRHYFSSMYRDFGVSPHMDHYTCMIDLLGRAGYLEEAKNMIEEMPMQPDSVIWGSFLAACKIHRHITLGEYAAEKHLEIDPSNSGPYVLLSNMYAELGRWGDVMRVRKLMRKQGVIKQPGCSWIDIQGHVNVFMVKDKRHPRKNQIRRLLKTLMVQMKQAGYIPDTINYEEYEEPDEMESALDDQMDHSADAAFG